MGLKEYVPFPIRKTSWNDLTDKPEGVGYTEKRVIVPETTVEVTSEGTIIGDIPLVAGSKYYVTWNGVVYSSVAKAIPDSTGNVIVYLGNYEVLFGTGDTGEPFVLGYVLNTLFVFDTSVTEEGVTKSVTFEIEGDIPVMIPHKYYIPGIFWVDVRQTETDGTTTYTITAKVSDVKTALDEGRLIGARLYAPLSDISYWVRVYQLRQILYNVETQEALPVALYFVDNTGGVMSDLSLFIGNINDDSYTVNISGAAN